MEAEQMKDLIRTYFELINNDRFDEFFELFDENIQLNGPFGFSAKSLKDVKPFYLDVPKNYSEHIDSPEDIFISGARAAVFIDFQGKTHTGQEVSFKATDWFEFKNGKIVSLNIFMDSYMLYTTVIKPKKAK